MREKEVKKLAKEWLKAQGYKVRPEPPAPANNNERELALDFYAYRRTEPEVLWIEAKGDVNLSQLLGGFIRTELCVYYGGGLGLLALSTSSRRKLMKYEDFLKQSGETIALLDVQEGKVFKFHSA